MTDDLKHMDVKNIAKLLRKELKETFPKQVFSVRIDRYSLGEAIDIKWTDGVAISKVEPIARKYEDISYDLHSGEILSGCNRFVQCHRSYSDGLAKQIEQKIRGIYFEGSFKEGYDPSLQSRVWRYLSENDF